jgi:uncharacterized protein DUF5808
MVQQTPKRFLGVPYDWRRPTWPRFKGQFWNPNDRRVFTPQVFGWGYAINVHALARRLGLLRRR